jgi:hypothetical protein
MPRSELRTILISIVAELWCDVWYVVYKMVQLTTLQRAGY